MKINIPGTENNTPINVSVTDTGFVLIEDESGTVYLDMWQAAELANALKCVTGGERPQ